MLDDTALPKKGIYFDGERFPICLLARRNSPIVTSLVSLTLASRDVP
jgi:hypothetical protein